MSLRFCKSGCFWRLVLPGGYLSQKRFLTKRGASKYYYDHLNKNGMPAIKRKEVIMPVRKLKSGGYRYGNTGKIYKSKAPAVKQGIAIRLSQKRAGKKVK